MNANFQQELQAEFALQNELIDACEMKPNFTPIRHPQPSKNVDNMFMCDIHGCNANAVFTNEKQLKHHWDIECQAYPYVCENTGDKVMRQSLQSYDIKAAIMKQI